MAVPTGTSAAIYSGNSSAVTPYPVPFPYLLASDIYVAVHQADVDPVILAQGVEYTLTPLTDSNGNITGGSVTTASPYNNTWTVTVFRQVPLTQLTELPEAGPISSRVIEKGYDKLVMAAQQLHRRILSLEGGDDGGSVIVIPEGSTGDVLQDVQSFANATARGNAIPRRIGQLGVQIDNGTLWRSHGSGAGSWVRQTAEAQEEAAGILPSANSYTDTKVAERVPAGCILPYGGATAPSGWLLCHGQTVSRTTYASLFSAIGTTFGAGDGSTTFALPDLRGRAAFGKDDMGGSAASRITASGTGNPGVNGSALGAAGGVDRHTLSWAQMPAHAHGIGNSAGGASGGAFVAATFNAGASNTGAAGSGEAHTNLPPALILNYIIRT